MVFSLQLTVLRLLCASLTGQLCENHQGEVYEENLDVVFNRLAFPGNGSAVASADERRNGEGRSRTGTTVASVTKDK
jgi:hypothetical protein